MGKQGFAKKIENRKNEDLKPLFLFPAFLFFLVLLVYGRVLTHEFLYGFDDFQYIVDNPHVNSGLSFRNILWAFTTPYVANWHPITWISHMIDCSLFGLSSGAHHLMNVLLHAVNSLLVFFLFHFLFKGFEIRLFLSLFASLLFALHPMHVESVAWISERKDTLSAFFWLLGTLSYVRYVRENNRNAFKFTLVCLGLGLLSKQMLVTFPFALLLLDFWPLKRGIGRKILLEKLPMFGLALAASLIIYLVQNQGAAVREFSEIDFWLRVENGFTAYVLYLGKFFIPANLSVFYPLKRISTFTWVFAFSFFLLITFLSLMKRKDRPWLLTGWFWFTGTLVPVIGLVQVGYQSMADRYTYIPYIGLCIPLAFEIYKVAKGRGPYLKTFLVLMGSVFSLLTFTELSYWKNTFTLCEEALRVTEDNFMALNNLGGAYFKSGDPGRAEFYFRRAIASKPDNVAFIQNLAEALMKQGRVREAGEELEKALALKPGNPELCHNLGVLYFNEGEKEKAVTLLEKAVATQPDFAQGYVTLIKVLKQMGKRESAEKYLPLLEKLNPKLAASLKAE